MDVGWAYGKKLQIPVWLVWEKQFTPTIWGVQIAVAALDFYRHSWKTVKKIIALRLMFVVKNRRTQAENCNIPELKNKALISLMAFKNM